MIDEEQSNITVERNLYDQETQISSKTPPKKSVGKGIFILPIFIILLILYYATTFSTLFLIPSVNFIIKFFIFPFVVVPEDFFVFKGAWIAAPNLFTITLALGASLLFIYLFSRFLYRIAIILGLKNPVIFSFLIIFLIGFIGSMGRQKYCEYNFYKLENNNSQKYLDTGIIHFELDDLYNRNWNHTFLLKNLHALMGIKHLSGNKYIVAQVKPGKEANKLCKINTYPEVNITNPVTEEELFRNPSSKNSPTDMLMILKYWSYLDPTFCETNQLIEHSKAECLTSIENKRAYVINHSASKSQLKNLDGQIISFNYPSIYSGRIISDDENRFEFNLYYLQKYTYIAKIKIDEFNNSYKPSIVRDYEQQEYARKNNPNQSQKIQQIQIGAYTFYKYQVGELLEEVTYYEAPMSDIGMILSVEAKYPGYENYIEIIEDIIKTIKIKTSAINDKLLVTLKYNDNGNYFLINKNKDQSGYYDIYQINSPNQDKTIGSIFIQEAENEGNLDSFEKDQKQLMESLNRSLIKEVERIKLGDYEYIKVVSIDNIEYDTYLGNKRTRISFNSPTTEESIKKFEYLVSNIKYNF